MVETVQGTNIDTVFAAIGFGKAQLLLIFTCGLLTITILVEALGMSIVIVASQCDLGTNDMQKSLIVSAYYFGLLISSYYLGYLADIRGRRLVIMYCTFLGNCSTCLAAFSPSITLFICLRFFSGMFLTGPATLAATYAAEFNTPRLRRQVINVVNCFNGIGMTYAPFVASMLFSHKFSTVVPPGLPFSSWRLLMLLYALPSFIGALIMLICIPESPNLLLSVGKVDEAFKSLEWICKLNNGKDLKDFDITSIQPEDSSQDRTYTGFFDSLYRESLQLFQKPHLCNLLNCSIVMFGIFFCSNGLGMWFPTILKDAETSKNGNVSVCEILKRKSLVKMEQCNDTIQSYNSLIVLGCAYISGYILIDILLRIMKRKFILAGALTISFVSGYIVPWVRHPLSMVIGFILFFASAGVMISMVCSILVDLIPTRLRSKAVCTIFAAGRIATILFCELLGPYVKEYCIWLLNFVAAFTTVCVAITLTMFL